MSQEDPISRVYRTKAQAKASYDQMSRFYDYLAGAFEKKYRDRALNQLEVKSGETVLEVGFGTGHCLNQIAESVGEEGKVYGIDISSRMLEVSKNRLKKAGLLDRVKLSCGDALDMPYEDSKFDAEFISFTLELFDTPEIPTFLQESRRVLKPGGRLGAVSLSKENGGSLPVRLYEWVHEKFPQWVDCRPIYAEESIHRAGFKVGYKEKKKMLGLPVEIVVGTKPA